MDHTPLWAGRISAGVPARFYQETPPPTSIDDARRLDLEHTGILAQITQQIEERNYQLIADGLNPETEPNHCRWLAAVAKARRFHLAARSAYQAWLIAERSDQPKPARPSIGDRLLRIENRLTAIEQALEQQTPRQRSP